MQIGVIIDNGPQDWQIIQQINGKADINISGNWVYMEPIVNPKVYARIVKEETGDTVVPWQPSEEIELGKWSITLENVPVGGLYRLETCLNHDSGKMIEWAFRGDMIHHLGVGDLYVIAGQSNSAGYGKDPIYDPPEIGIHVLKNSGKWDIASHPLNESTNTIHEENREGANPGHSPYLNFARQLKRELNYPIGLIQAALGGSPLSAWNPEEDGVLYRSMLSTIIGQGGRVRGVLWYQGCSDVDEVLSKTYLKRFRSMVSHLRDDLCIPVLPVFTVQLNRLVTTADDTANRNWGRLREAQRQAALEIEGVYIIPANDCTLSDLIHNNSASNMVLGERLAKIVLNNLHGKNFMCNAPNLKEARMTEDGKILLAFDNIYYRLDVFEIGTENLPFIIEDEMGYVNIIAYSLNHSNTIRLTPERELVGKARVHGAYEQSPRGVIPIDCASHLPMLSFYGAEIISE